MREGDRRHDRGGAPAARGAASPRSLANGVVGAELIGRERLAELEPHAAGIRALHVPSTGVVDFAEVARAYADDVEAAGGSVLVGHEVTGVATRGRDAVQLSTSAGDVEASHVVACAGVYADRVARLCGGSAEPRIVPFRGDYYVLRPERREPRQRARLPGTRPDVPIPRHPHDACGPDGSVWLGPNAVLAFARDGYGRFHVRPRDLAETLATPGFRRLARRHWRTGAVELVRDYSRRLFVASARKLLPGAAPRGRRARAGRHPRAGDRARTAVSSTTSCSSASDRVLHVRNAPSPGATSSLPIGEAIADMAVRRFSL